ncbi:MAG: tetratricopeptide repeat protein [Bacteroidales bacterium]|nr:tetratricopeptide repeat protein [Bacteroidales bacterium]
MKNVFTLLIIFVFSFTAIHAQKGKVTAALNLIVAANFEKAKQNLDLAVQHEKSKDWPKTYYALGKFYHELYKSDQTELKEKYGNLLEEAYLNYKKAGDLDSLNKLENYMNLDLLDIYNKLFSDGVDEFNEKNYNEATKLWEYAIDIRNYSVLLKDDIDSSTMYNIGIAALNAKDYNKALDYFNRVLEIDYGGANVYVLMKNAYIEMEDSAAALKTLQTGFESFPEDQAILVELINYYLMSGGSQEALEYLKLAKEQDPTNPTFYHAEGVLYDKMGEFDKSVESYKKAIEIKPDFFDSHYNLGVLYFNKAVVIAEEANMTLDDKKYEKLRAEADEIFLTALPLFEECLKIMETKDLNEGDNKKNMIDTMENLKILYYRLKMDDKHADIKARLDELKGE